MAGRNKKIVAFVLALFILLSPAALWAAEEPSFRLDMDSLNLQKGVSATLIISTVNAQGAQIINIEGLEHFEIVSQNSMTSTSVVNGEITYGEDLYVTLMPLDAGQFTLKANVLLDDVYYESNELAVSVEDGAAQNGQPARDLFVSTVCSHTDAYIGEKIIVTYLLYSRYNMENYGFTDYIAIDGAVVSEMPNDRLKSEYVYIDGVRYAMYEAARLIIDPVRSGEFYIPSFNFQANVISERGRAGMGSFFRQATPVYVQTDEVVVNVKPLPQEGRPADFSGIVGQFSLDGRYSRLDVEYGESLILYLTASGNCGLDVLNSVLTGKTEGFSTYETVKNTAETAEDGVYRASKDIEIIFVPETNGTLELPPISVSYFDPVSGRYEQAGIPGASVTVSGDMPSVEPAAYSGSKQVLAIEQVSYTNINDGYITLRLNKEHTRRALIGLAALLAAACGAVLAVKKMKKRDNELKVLYKSIMSGRDINEIYNLFNAMVKRRYAVSLKAGSRTDISDIGGEAAKLITGVVDYMESPESRGANGQAVLKSKIKDVYRIIKAYNKPRRIKNTAAPA